MQATAGLFSNWQFFGHLRQRLVTALAPIGVQPRDFLLLSIVREQARSQRELAAVCALDPSSMVPVVDALEQRGWIERRRDPHDRRVHLITLSAAGKRVHTRALRLAQKMEAVQMQRLSETERVQLAELLRKLVNG